MTKASWCIFEQYCFVDEAGILWAIVEETYKPVSFITQDGEALVFAE